MVFLCSIIISVGFKGTKIWLTRMISNLCRKPYLLSKLHDFLVSVNAAGVTKRHEIDLEIDRMNKADPTSQIIWHPNIWNLCVIDNIDFKAKNLKSKMLLQVHDELVFDVLKEELEIAKSIIENRMKHAIPSLRVPMEVGMGVGKNWLEAH